MNVIIIIGLIFLAGRLLYDAGAAYAKKRIGSNPEFAEPDSHGDPLPTPSDCRDMIIQFFDIVRAANEKSPYTGKNLNHLNIYGGGTDNMHLHIEFEKDFYGIDNIVRNQLGYDLPAIKPEGGGWYSDGRRLCFDSDCLTGGFKWQCDCLRSESALTHDFQGIIESYFPNFRYKNFKSEYLVDYYSFLAIGEG